jgi:hypothetical protein
MSPGHTWGQLSTAAGVLDQEGDADSPSMPVTVLTSSTKCTAAAVEGGRCAYSSTMRGTLVWTKAAIVARTTGPIHGSTMVE